MAAPAPINRDQTRHARTRPTPLDRARATGMIPWREDEGIWKILSASIPGLPHTIAVEDGEAVSCSCRAGQLGLDCKHRAAVQHYLDRRIWPAIRRCVECGTDPVNVRGEMCHGCATARRREVLLSLIAAQPYPEPAPIPFRPRAEPAAMSTRLPVAGDPFDADF